MYRWLHDSHKPVYTISVAAELIGCHPRTLRIYEEEELVQPKRTQKKYRLYSQHDLTKIKRLNSLMAEWGLTLAGVRAMLKMAERFHIEVESMLDEMLK
ncbi:MAG: MerR family transcriptional regulator [Candidatus Margulisbacteria bacterium]|nr:MerR family transcriptional regulator [Candidatus Margulisiibacteriota bacterium]